MLKYYYNSNLEFICICDSNTDTGIANIQGAISFFNADKELESFLLGDNYKLNAIPTKQDLTIADKTLFTRVLNSQERQDVTMAQIIEKQERDKTELQLALAELIEKGGVK